MHQATSPHARPARAIPAALFLLAAVTRPGAALAQDYVLDRTASVSGGVAQFDLSGTGTTPMVAVRTDAELTRWLVAELGVSALRPKEDIGGRLTYVVPEAQLQLQLRAGALRPYLGAGGGYWGAVGAGRTGRSRATASGAAGVRIHLSDPRFSLRAEARMRGIGRRFEATTAEFTGGIALRF